MNNTAILLFCIDAAIIEVYSLAAIVWIYRQHIGGRHGK
jgi:hypothetical protein